MSSNADLIQLLEAGIRAEGLRQQTIAGNIANIDTPGYKRADVRFEELVAKALRGKSDADVSDIQAKLYQPQTTPVGANGNDVSLDTEIGQMVKNTLMHKTYLLALRKKYQQMSSAIQV